MNRILVTGGFGFIGSNLVQKLVALPQTSVRVFDSGSVCSHEHLYRFSGEIVVGDIRDRKAVDEALRGIDAVVHLAADTRVVDSIQNPNINFDVNVRGTVNLLEAMRTQGITRLINASTGGAIVGRAEPPVHEELAPQPLSPYGASKLAGEGYCSAYSASYGLQALSLRFSNVYGPRSLHKKSVVTQFFKNVLRGEALTVYGDGEQSRDFIYINDLCDGIISGLRGGLSGIVQLGSGRPVRLNSLIDEIRTVVAPLQIRVNHVPARVGEVIETYCRIDKAQRLLGFTPRVSLSHGLATTWQWFLESSIRRIGLDD